MTSTIPHFFFRLRALLIKEKWQEIIKFALHPLKERNVGHANSSTFETIIILFLVFPHVWQDDVSCSLHPLSPSCNHSIHILYLFVILYITSMYISGSYRSAYNGHWNKNLDPVIIIIHSFRACFIWFEIWTSHGDKDIFILNSKPFYDCAIYANIGLNRLKLDMRL